MMATVLLVLPAGADVKYVDLERLTGGIVHTKFWVVDGKHVYIGSANMDWRSLTQVPQRVKGRQRGHVLTGTGTRGRGWEEGRWAGGRFAHRDCCSLTQVLRGARRGTECSQGLGFTVLGPCGAGLGLELGLMLELGSEAGCPLGLHSLSWGLEFSLGLLLELGQGHVCCVAVPKHPCLAGEGAGCCALQLQLCGW